jgi:hypothetical protein
MVTQLALRVPTTIFLPTAIALDAPLTLNLEYKMYIPVAKIKMVCFL